MNAIEAFKAHVQDLEETCMTRDGLTGHAMHDMAHWKEALSKVGDNATDSALCEMVERLIDECEVCK